MKPDWKDAPPDAKWLAMDENGDWWWYTDVPSFDAHTGNWSIPSLIHDSAYPAYQPDVIASESLEQRPSTTTPGREG